MKLPLVILVSIAAGLAIPIEFKFNAAAILFLLAAMPVGIAAPSLSGLSKGNVAPATCLLMISTGLSLLIFPMFGFLLYDS